MRPEVAAEVMAAAEDMPAVVAISAAADVAAVAGILAVADISAAERISAARVISVVAEPVLAAHTSAAGLRYRGPRVAQVSARNARSQVAAFQTGPRCRT
jgi:hypothetical protein